MGEAVESALKMSDEPQIPQISNFYLRPIILFGLPKKQVVMGYDCDNSLALISKDSMSLERDC